MPMKIKICLYSPGDDEKTVVKTKLALFHYNRDKFTINYGEVPNVRGMNLRWDQVRQVDFYRGDPDKVKLAFFPDQLGTVKSDGPDVEVRLETITLKKIFFRSDLEEDLIRWIATEESYQGMRLVWRRDWTLKRFRSRVASTLPESFCTFFVHVKELQPEQVSQLELIESRQPEDRQDFWLFVALFISALYLIFQ